jgi:hypothetical protein
MTMAFGRPHLIFLRRPPGPSLPPPRAD